ncbi:MAG: chromosomal replication initiator protein DnaA [Spirochaetia bacterium]|nr:chromosomal replication initiator protein DnaA [Spirochaetia bacterium]MCF7940279.1 chromosomal replication initiator protein DnaA [Spirochaetia bacterium]
MNETQYNYYDFWKEVLTQIKIDLNDQEFTTWFSRIDYDSSKAETIILAVPSKFVMDQIKQRYSAMITKTLHELSGSELSIDFIIKKREAKQVVEGDSTPERPSQERASYHKKQTHLEDKSANYSFDSFIVGDNSSFAFNACMAIAKNPGTAYNPCLIYGGVGLGKTHLIQSVGKYVSENIPEMKVTYVTAEAFTNEFIQAIGDKKIQPFKNKYRKVDILLIDDIHFLQGKESTQEELFHTFNDLYDSNKQMIFTCDRPVSELKKLAARLRSRFERGLNVDLQPPNYETRLAILRKKCVDHNYAIADEILSFISRNINTNVRDLEASLTKLIAYSKLLNKEVTLKIAQEQLKDSYSLNRDHSIAIETIQKVVADYFNLSYIELRSKKRTRAIAVPRQIAMYIARNMTDYSTTEIGYDFGGRDHTTVMHACQKIESLIQTDSSMDNTIQKLMRDIKEYKRDS